MIEDIKSNTWLFGAGYWAQILMKKINLKFTNHSVQVIDPNNEALEELSSKYSFVVPSSFETFQKKAKKGDFGFVVTPPITHYQIAKNLLDMGCHTWVEKPIATEVAQAEELIRKAKAHDLTLFIDNTFLFDPLILSLKKLCQKGNKINHIHSRRQGWGKVLKDLGVLWDLLPHDLSIVNNIFGKIQSYHLLSINFGPENSILNRTSLAASIMMKTEDNMTVQIDLSVISRNKIREIQLMNSNELITYNLNSDGSNLFRNNWNSLPGLINTETQLIAENIASNEDSLSNALNCFIGLAKKGILHESIEFVVHEIGIIQDLYEKSQLLFDQK